MSNCEEETKVFSWIVRKVLKLHCERHYEPDVRTCYVSEYQGVLSGVLVLIFDSDDKETAEKICQAIYDAAVPVSITPSINYYYGKNHFESRQRKAEKFIKAAEKA